MSIDRIETDKVLQDFRNVMSPEEFEREGLGIWLGFRDEELGVIIASPKHDGDQAGCSVFFGKAVSEEEAGRIAKQITRRYDLHDPQWITASTGKRVQKLV